MKPSPNISSPAGRSGALSQGIISMAAYGVNFGASFFAIIGIANLLGPSDFGVFSVAIQVVAFTAMISDFGMGPVIMRRLAIAPGRSLSVLLEATFGRLVLLVPTWLLTMIIGWLIKHDFSFILLLNIMLINVVISAKLPVLRGTLESFYRSQSRMGVPTVTMAIDSLVLLAAVLVVPMSFHDPVSAMIIYTASNLVGAAVLLGLSVSYARRLNSEPVVVRWTGMRELIISSAPLAVYLLFNALHVSIETIYLKMFQGDAQAGLFGAAMRIMTPLAVFPTILAISAVPHFARASVAEDDEQRAKMTRLFSLLVKTLLIGSALLAGLGLINARLLVTTMFKLEYADAVVPMALLSALFLPMSLNIFLVELNNARGHLRNNTVFAAILAGVSVLAGIPLIIWYAAPGAAISKILAVIAGLAFLIFHSREGLAVAMKPVIGKTAILFFSLIAVWLLLGDEHWILTNAAALLIVLIELFLLRVYSADEIGQWKSQIAGMFRRGRAGVASSSRVAVPEGRRVSREERGGAERDVEGREENVSETSPRVARTAKRDERIEGADPGDTNP